MTAPSFAMGERSGTSRSAPYTAAAFDPDDYLLRYPRQVLATSEGRRRACKYDPLLFALVYMRDSLRSPETGNRITLSQFHLDIAESATRWAKTSLEPMELREAWVAPRGVGKSTWMFLILPAWALAYGHRKYVAAFADNGTMAKNHLATFKRKIQTENQLLRKDFPDLCAALRRPGGVTDSDRQDLYLARSGATFQASGIESTTLGAKVGDQRPDMLLFDDIEPPADQYSPGQKEGRLSLIREAILPMNLNAVVQLVGTVTMDGSISHDIVRQAVESEETVPAWVAAENISTRYYPALVTEPQTGAERSLWPARWSTEFLHDFRRRSPRTFAMNYMNQPVPLNSAYWTEDMFHHERLDGLTRHIISVDPAVTTKRSSDYTGIAVLSWSHDGRIMIRHTEMVKLSPADLRRHILQLLIRFPYVRGVLVETNQGGDTWKGSVFHAMPVPVEEIKQTVKKENRWAALLDLWTGRRVVHDPDGQTGPFERQAIAVPKSANDDVVDAVTSGVDFMVKQFGATQTPARRKSRVVSYAA